MPDSPLIMPQKDFDSDEKGHRANVTALEQFAKLISLSLIPTGGLCAIAGTSVPAGFLACDGSAQSRNTYAALFNQIGTTYGAGDGITTFNVPTRLQASRVYDGGATVGTNGLIIIRTGAF